MSVKIDIDNCYNDSAEKLYSYLESSLQCLPDYKISYSILNIIYSRILNQNTSFVTIKLVGRFAKTEYLLKEFNATKELSYMINDFRTRINKINDYTDDALKKIYLYDLKTLSQFISLIYNTPVPQKLFNHFPKDKLLRKRENNNIDYIRVIVHNWDNEYIYCISEEDRDKEIKIYYGAECGVYKYNWSYISELLYENAQLNIIKPIYENDILIPELIIFEPDYLVDISSIAACFESYAEDAILYLLNKIKPNITSEAILLGNLASQFLDEEIHSKYLRVPYNDSIKTFFKNNALSLLAANVSQDFHLNAKNQKTNIQRSIGKELPKIVSSINFDNILLEPSFFSEMLGLQGRMDLLQSDFSLLIEQKSGKCGFPQLDADTPIALKKHYVQMLLYMTILRYNYPVRYKENNNKLNTFLLYSKYKNSLLGLGYAPELVFQSLKIRNEIVRNEYKYAEGGISILKELTPDKINSKNVCNNLWNKYIYPQLTALLAPIHNATELELEYYLQFLKFIENEHIYSKVGNKQKENSGFASKWHDTLEEKLNAGNIYDKLSLITPSINHIGIVDEIELKFNDTTNHDIANFRVGDIVILYPYNKNTIPDLRKTIVHRCTISSISSDVIKLTLRATQTNAKIFIKDLDKLWTIEHDFFESSYNSLYRGMHTFISAPKERKDLILLQRTPKVDYSKRLNGEYAAFNELALRVKQAEDLFLIIGPPGTGKTSFGLLTTLKEELTEENSNILLLSYTNRAVDEICSKLVEEDIEFIRIGNKNSCDNRYKEFLLENKSNECSNVRELNTLITNTRVIVGTTASLCNNSSLFDLKQFSLAIIDEASQILEPNIIGILSEQRNGIPVIKKFVMIGDHKQLPAVVQQPNYESKTDKKILNNIYLTDCSLSLFERLLRKYRDNASVTYMLTKQGRMHYKIADIPNKQFYNSNLDIVPLPHQIEELESIEHSNKLLKILSSHRVVFFSTKTQEKIIANKVNINEAELIANIIYTLYNMYRDNFDTNKTIGVIVPYRNQIATIKHKLQTQYPGLGFENITIDTIERFQGSQREHIIYGFTIQETSQLKFLTENSFIEDNNIIDRKLNVAMTRAKRQLIFVGNADLLSINPLYSTLINYLKENKAYFNYPI